VEGAVESITRPLPDCWQGANPLRPLLHSLPRGNPRRHALKGGGLPPRNPGLLAVVNDGKGAAWGPNYAP